MLRPSRADALPSFLGGVSNWPWRIIFFCVLSISFSTAYNLCEEWSSIAFQKYQLPWFVSMLELMFTSAFSFIATILLSWTRSNPNPDRGTSILAMPSKQKLKILFLVGFSTLLARGLANFALQVDKMDYPSYVICKSTKVMVVMVASVVINKRRYPRTDYIFAALLVASLVCFKLADFHENLWNGGDKTVMDGIAVMATSLVFSALKTNFQETVMSKPYNLQPLEVTLWSSVFAIGLLLTLTGLNGELRAGITALVSDGMMVPWMLFRGSFLFGLVLSNVFLIMESTAVFQQYVSVVRKLLTIILSFLVNHRDPQGLHYLGGLAFLVALTIKLNKNSSQKTLLALEDPKEHVNDDIVSTCISWIGGKYQQYFKEENYDERRVLV